MTTYKNFRNVMMALLGAVMVYFTACKEDTLRSSECDIVSFAVDGEAWTIKGTDITHSYPANTDVSALKPTITVSEGATVSPASGVPLDFAANVAYTVTAEDGTTKKTYTVKVTVAAATDAEITAFSTGGEAWSISGTDITKTFPYGTDVTALAPTILVSTGATVAPASGVAQNFSAAAGVAYTVTAADGTTKKTYTAKATVAPPDASNECDITAFTVNGEDWTIDATTNTITHTYPAGTTVTVTALTPTITLSEKATVDPASDVEQDFSSADGVIYIVTAEDGTTTKEYTVKVTVAAFTGAEILSFSTDGGTWTIDGLNITKTFPSGTDIIDLEPTIVVSEGATIDPASSVSRSFFSADGATYTVTSEDGEKTNTYTVKATVAPPDVSNACDITAFSTDGGSWTISGSTITKTFPYDTDVTALTPIITLSDSATVSPASSFTVDFSKGAVTYTVTAADGETTKIYTAEVTFAASTEAEIKTFSTDGGDWIISGSTITKTFPYDTDVSALTTTITVSAGATVEPASGTAQDFSQGAVTYTVTAADGETTKIYTAEATVAPPDASDACDIESFSTTDGGTWTITGTDIAGTLTAGTDIAKLVPIIIASEGATVDPPSSSTVNFSQGAVTYTVTAADGIKKQIYTATATVLASTEAEIETFTTANGTWTITGTDIAGTLTAKTDIAKLVPIITVSAGATVTPASSTTVDFSKGAVTYTVTAEDSKTTKIYTAKATVLASDEAEITAFTAGGGTWAFSGTTITKNFPYKTDVSALTTTITVSTGATVTPPPGVQDFSKGAVTYTVTAESGKKVIYTAEAIVASPSTVCEITAFIAGGETWTFSGTTITGAFPYGTTPASLTPTITVSDKATVDPDTGVAQDFFTAAGVIYTVTAESGATQTYTAKAIVASASTVAEITGFTVGGEDWDFSGTTITHTYPANTDVTKLTPTIVVSTGATVTPDSGEENDFSTEVTYTVTAEDGTTEQTYIVKVTVEAPTLSKACDITKFTVGGKDWDFSGTTITHTYPANTDVTKLTPTITVSDKATVDPASGTEQDFSQDVTYTVTAEDGTKKFYLVTVTVEAPTLSSACEITTFTVGEDNWDINDLNITYTYPFGTDVTKLVPTIVVSDKATVTPDSGEENDFSQGAVIYTVTAEDGKTEETYTVTVTVTPASSECKITWFGVNNWPWNIDDENNLIYYEYQSTDGEAEYDLFYPGIEMSEGASVSPDPNEGQYLRDGVTYVVTAQDGITHKEYYAKATVAGGGELSSECDIKYFGVREQEWTINGTNIYAEYTGLHPDVWFDIPNHGFSLYECAPSISVSEDATIDPDPGVLQNFFTEKGVNYEVTAADGTKKVYNVKAWIKKAETPSGTPLNKTDWNAVSQKGDHDWSDLGACGNVPNPTQEHCGEGNHAGGGADKVLDGNVWTGWHSNPGVDLPQVITIDMTGSKEVSSLVLHHRPDALGVGHPSWIYFNKIQVYLSNNADNFGDYVTEYTWDGAIPATINLSKTTGRYLMLVFPDSNVSSYISFSELDVYGTEPEPESE
jgi:hypothetical protein